MFVFNFHFFRERSMTDRGRPKTGGWHCNLRFFCRFSVFFSGLLVAGCISVGPDYQRPEVTVPQAWRQGDDPAMVPDRGVACRWWTVFGDPLLERLIAEAAQNNLDVRQAVARVREARARLGVARGEHWPQVDTQGSVVRQRTSENGLSGVGVTETLYDVGLDASWEIDLFGRIRRSVEAARADFQASEEDRGDVLVSLYAEMARTYFNIRTYQARLVAAEGNIASQQKVLKLTRARFENGLATGLDMAQAEQVLAASQAELPPLRIGLVQAINTMGVLLGRPPGALFEELSRPGAIPVPPSSIAVGVPADLLRQRPDIRRAERQLAAQTARIGVAKADLYPRLSLSGSFGFEAIDVGDLFRSGSKTYGFGPTLRWLLFDGARVRGQIRVQDALTEQALYSYEQSVLNALNEAENALTEYLEQRNRLAALERSVSAAQRSVRLATRLYKDGLVDFQSVLDAQRELFNNENQLAAARGNTVINLVQLYKALGGGWNPDTQAAADALSGTPKEEKS
jgi:NodT family efflux transporter outer membrane factor (OMF) lipoprotein